MSWLEGRVIENRRWCEGHHSIKVEAPGIPFVAGQFVRLGLDIDGERIARPYSFVNAPHESPLEFYFNTQPRGVLSNRMSALQTGDTLWVATLAAGFLILSEVPEAEHLWLLAAGTAIGPFISILRTDEPWQRFSKIILVHGAKNVAELVYQDDIRHFKQQRGEQFSMVPSVTREHLDHAIEVRIPEAILSGELEQRVGFALNPEQSQVMVCGMHTMIDDTMEVLRSRGLKKHRRWDPGQITTEDYG